MGILSCVTIAVFWGGSSSLLGENVEAMGKDCIAITVYYSRAIAKKLSSTLTSSMATHIDGAAITIY